MFSVFDILIEVYSSFEKVSKVESSKYEGLALKMAHDSYISLFFVVTTSVRKKMKPLDRSGKMF